MKDIHSLDILLRQVGRAHSNRINEILDKYNLHQGQPVLLDILCKDNGIPQAKIVKEMGIKPATVSVMVKRMEKNGCVVRKRDAKDERISNVYITDKGRELHEVLSDLQGNMDDIAFAGFTMEEKKIMEVYLNRILKNLSK